MASSHSKARRSELSWLNLLFCAMVLWAHCSSHALANLNHASWQYALTFSLQRLFYVSVYGFFFLSGLKLTLSPKRPKPLTFWAKRVRTIVLPYCLAVAVYYYYFCQIMHYYTPSPAGYVGFAVRGNLSAQFYFVVALAQFILLGPVMYWLSERWSPVLLLPAAVIITLLSSVYCNDILGVFAPGTKFSYNDRIFTSYLIYYLAGCCAGRRYKDFLAMLEKNRRLIAGLYGCVAAFDLVMCWYGYALQRPIPFAIPVSMFHFLSSILFCFLIAVRLPKVMPKWLAAADRASYLIYLYHVLVIVIFDVVLYYWGITKVIPYFILRTVCVFTVTPLLCILWQRLWTAVRGTLRKATPPTRERR